MPVENLEEEGLEKNPNLNLAQWKFMLSTDRYKYHMELKMQLLEGIKSENMAPYYESVCADLSWPVDEGLLTQMKDANKSELEKLDKSIEDAETNQGETEIRDAMLKKAEYLCRIGDKMKDANKSELEKLDKSIEDAETNQGETEIRDAMLKKAEYLCRIGDKEAALSQFRKTQEKTVTLGFRLDLVFHLIRIGIFYNDHDLITRNLDKAQSLIDEGGDWDRRNRLKVYRGLYCMSIRDFSTAADLFLDTIATFTSYELMKYHDFVKYTVYCSMIALQRPDLREKVTRGSEILEVLHSLPPVKNYLFSLYDCHYGAFFKALAFVEDEIQCDRYLSQHSRYYVREMRILAYSQLLESYRSLTLTYMADAFGVTPEFIDQELSRFIAAGRLHCKIDKVGGIVETNRPDSKNWQYQATIKQGDILLNRVQKLSRVINI